MRGKKFTPEELKVFGMRYRGLSVKEIAGKLGASEDEVTRMLAQIKEKIKDVEDSIELLTGIGVIKEGPKFTLAKESWKSGSQP